MEPAEISARFKIVNDVLRAMKHAMENFEATDDLARERSAFRDFVNSWAELTWVMKAQLQAVVGGHDAYVAWWDEASRYLKKDPACAFFWGIRQASAHEGRLGVRSVGVTDLSLADLERVDSLPPGVAISYGLDEMVVVENAPEPLNRYPAWNLMRHARNLAVELMTIATRDLAPHIIHLAKDPNGKQIQVDPNELLTRWRGINASTSELLARVPE